MCQQRNIAVQLTIITRNSSGDEIANVNFLYYDIENTVQNTIIDSCINYATDIGLDAVMCWKYTGLTNSVK